MAVSWEIPDNKGKTIVATIHYGKEYDNGFWNGQELVLGDGDGVIYRKGGFASLSILAHEIAISVNQWTAQLTFQGQSGAMAESFANIMSCLVEQWQKRQTSDEASWLVGADVLFAPGFKGRALIDAAHPGTAYDDPNLGKDQQPGRKDYIHAAADNGGVHTNFGIPNKAFYELSNKIKGYGWEKPGRI